MAIEAVGFYRWLWELLEPLVQKLVLCDATQARALAGRRLKTDREDALNIAELLAAGRLPMAYAPPMEVQMLRDWTVIAEIGDFLRFPDAKAIGRYAGLTPTLYASGGKERHGHISKTGPRDLRWVLQQAAWVFQGEGAVVLNSNS